MKDIHSHLLYEMDDGSSSIEESIYIIKQLVEIGYTDLILTPHYIEDSKYNANNSNKLNHLNQLKKELIKEKIDINLYLGNEVYVTNESIELNNNKKITTLADSKYILVEFSLYKKNEENKEILLDILKQGYIPVLAHPERYIEYQQDLTFYQELVKEGILLQGNLFSLVSKSNSKKTLIKLLKNNLIHFIATDIHKKEDLELFDKAMKKLNKTINKEKQNELLNTNIKKILDNEKFGGLE